ncbi:GGDEF domain-containing protein [Magnetococcales bacterium HHB-1]
MKFLRKGSNKEEQGDTISIGNFLADVAQLLRRAPPKTDEALSMIKDFILKNPTFIEENEAKKILIFILEQLTPFAHPEVNYLSDRLKRRIKKEAFPHTKDIIDELETLADLYISFIPEEDPDLPPETLPKRLAETLIFLGERDTWLREKAFAFKEAISSEKPPSWEKINGLLREVINHGDITLADWRRERQEMRDTLMTVAQDFNGALEQFGQTSGNLDRMSTRIKEQGNLREDDIKQIRNLLLQEISTFQHHAESVTEKLQQSQAQVRKSQERLKALDEELLEMRDERLKDDFSGLPNRYAFLLRLRRNRLNYQRTKRPFSIIFMRIRKMGLIIRHLGDEQGRRLFLALIKRMRQDLRRSDFISIYDRERLLILLPGTPEEDALKTAQQLAAMLVHTRFRITQKTLRFFAGFAATSGTEQESEKRLLSRLEREAKSALSEEGGNYVSVHGQNHPPPLLAEEESEKKIIHVGPTPRKNLEKSPS